MKRVAYLLFAVILAGSCKSKKVTTEILKTDMNAKWGVEAIAGVADVPSGLNINLDLLKNRIEGFGGCNNFSGNAERDGFNIKFPAVMSTQMTCKNADAEQAYMKALSDTRKFDIVNNILRFYDKNGKELVRFVKMSR